MSKRVLGMIVGALLAGVLLALLLQRLEFTPPEDSTGQGAPSRVICMSPAVTEIVYALGQGDRVVGISQYATYPPEALGKPECGAFVNPNLERILALRPDLVIVQGISQKVTEFCQDRNIRLLTLDLTDLDSVFVAIEQVGQALECQKEAERLRAEMRGQLDAVARSVAGKQRIPVFIAAGRNMDSLRNLMTISKGSFLNDVLELAGGRNIFGELAMSYPTISKESLLERQPEAIIELCGEGMISQSDKAEIMATWKTLSALRAVRNGQVYAIGNTYALIPGPRVTILARDIADILHGPAQRRRPFACASD